MQRISLTHRRVLIVALAVMLAAGPALAEKPSSAGGGKGGKDQRNERSQESDGQHGQNRDRGDGESEGKSGRDGRAATQHFDDQHRLVVREYFDGQFQSGRCPPGLAKKHNGCMPPGHAKKWTMGRPLARDVIFYDVPHPLVVQIGLPPPGYRYVRVAGDILMIAIGTALVVDAIQDLGR